MNLRAKHRNTTSRAESALNGVDSKTRGKRGILSRIGIFFFSSFLSFLLSFFLSHFYLAEAVSIFVIAALATIRQREREGERVFPGNAETAADDKACRDAVHKRVRFTCITCSDEAAAQD